jgi:hypothetical protein
MKFLSVCFDAYLDRGIKYITEFSHPTTKRLLALMTLHHLSEQHLCATQGATIQLHPYMVASLRVSLHQL